MKEIKVTSVQGNTQLLDGGSMFGNAPKELWKKWITPDSLNRISLSCRSLLVEVDGLKILCEVGVGHFFESHMADRYGIQDPTQHILINNLNSLGIQEEDIDYVILSHLHFDHAAGLLYPKDSLEGKDGQLHFSKAQYLVGEEQWQRCQNPHPRDRASYLPELFQGLKNSNRLQIIKKQESPDFLKDQLSFYYSDGHTPGMMLATFKGKHKTLVFMADLIPGVHWIHSSITMGYDRFAEKVIDEKNDFYKQHTLNELLCFYTHDSEFAISGITQDKKGRYKALDPQQQIQQMIL